MQKWHAAQISVPRQDHFSVNEVPQNACSKFSVTLFACWLSHVRTSSCTVKN